MDNYKVEDAHSAEQVEMATHRSEEKSDGAPLKLDGHGFPLVPQPSDNSMDPLNWPTWLKILVLIQVSAISFLSLLAASLIVRHVLHINDRLP